MFKMITTFQLTILYTIVLLSNPSALKTVAAKTRSQEEIAKIYRTYDVPQEQAPSCPYESAGDIPPSDNLCPPDDGATSIGLIETITKFCEGNLSPSTVAASRTIEPDKGRNAMEGCKKFVACYIVRNKQKIPVSNACCPSERCNTFLAEQYVKMGILWDDDDDDRLPDEDDSGGDDGVLAREEAAVSADL